ncbi:actin binding protein, partial [Coemansia sp. RSA 355]
YDYDATADDELGFREGEIVYNVEQLDPGWWAAESKDGTRQGVFPSNFVELIDDDAPPTPSLPVASNDSPPPALPPRGGAGPISPAAPPMAPPLPQAPAQNDMGENYAVALFEYVAAEEGELSFEEGEYVTHIEFLSDDWWEGANKHGEFGLFPSNFVKLQK